MVRTRLLPAALAVAAIWAATAPAWSAKRSKAEPEVQLTGEELKKLDRFELHGLEKADKVFAADQYRQALAEYETFLQEYPRSTAVPYVLLRKGRCLQLDDKRNEAVRQYNEVLDYFPNETRYAAPALYYQGLCFWENGDETKAMKHWARMARDKEYCKDDRAAVAINHLADNLAKQGSAESAVGYYRQVAVEFRRRNPTAAYYARDQVQTYYIRSSPNEAKVREFYRETHTFGTPTTSDEDMLKSFAYWNSLRSYIARYGRFAEKDKELKDRYYRYWAEKLDGKFPEQDDYQIDVIRFKLAYEGDLNKYYERLDQLFQANQKSGDPSRIVRWIALMARNKARMTQHYNRLDFSKMDNDQVTALIKVLYDSVGDAKMAKNAFGKLNLAKMPDDKKAELAVYLFGKDFDLGKDACMTMQDKDRGKFVLLEYYASKKEPARMKEAYALADHLIGVPEYAARALWIKGGLLETEKKYAEAIQVYRQINDQPANLWRIAACYERMKRVKEAVQQLQEVETFFEKHRSQAAIRIAYVYKRASLTDQCVAAFRRVLTKYPDTGESSAAHVELESMNVTRIRGGVRDAKED